MIYEKYQTSQVSQKIILALTQKAKHQDLIPEKKEPAIERTEF